MTVSADSMDASSTQQEQHLPQRLRLEIAQQCKNIPYNVYMQPEEPSADILAAQSPQRCVIACRENPKFITQKREYNRQFAGMYWYRLEKLKPGLVQIAEERWSHHAKYVEKLLEVEAGVLCFVVGTIYMEMPLKPNVLDEISLENNIIAAPVTMSKYAGPDDQITLEDQSGRIQLTGVRIKEEPLVTGVVMALLGREGADGTFEVVDLAYSGLAPQRPLPSIHPEKPSTKLVAFVSGIQMGSSELNDTSLSMLVDFLTGALGSPQDAALAAKIGRVLICGDSMSEHLKSFSNSSLTFKKNSVLDSDCYDFHSLVALDAMLTQLSKSVTVDLLPGPKDPSSFIFPQQPLHKGILANANETGGLCCRSNPYLCLLDECEVLASAGQNVADLQRYNLECDDPLTYACASLKWRHIAPTTPDTLQCYAYQDEDPFILFSSPHVYVVGNQDKFQTTVVEDPKSNAKTRVIMVPRFAKSNQIVLLDVESMECFTMSFNVNM